MVAGTLHTFPESSRGLKARVAAAHSGFNLKVVELQASDKSHAHVPSFESDDKKTRLFEANAIAYFVANDQLRGTTLEDRTAVVQWLTYGSTELASAVASWTFPALSLVESSQALVQRAKDDLKREFAFLNEHLKTRTYLVGERLSLADIGVAADLLLAYKHVADEAFRKPFANVNRWFTTVVNQAHFKKVAGEVKLAVKAPEFDAKLFAQNKSNASAAGAKKQEKQEKPKQEKPAPAKKEAKKEVEADEEEDEVMAEEPKLSDPFAAMPKGNFNMDEFKRTYSNNDTKTVAMPYFWKHFEKEFYSLWFCEYKYPEELAKVFMTSNLIGGMFQRIERLRKNAFGSMCVWGDDNSNTIAGVWFWKGQELAFPLSPDWTTDYESYTWRKMNPDDENDRKLVDQFWSWEGDLKGKKFAVGKIFK